jgi:hypothetical protein
MVAGKWIKYTYLYKAGIQLMAVMLFFLRSLKQRVELFKILCPQIQLPRMSSIFFLFTW